jgi:hypothetical protein
VGAIYVAIGLRGERTQSMKAKDKRQRAKGKNGGGATRGRIVTHSR